MKQAKDRSRRRVKFVVAAWVCGVLAVLTGAMWAAGTIGEPSLGAGGVCASVTGSQLQIAVANQPVERWQERWYFREATAAVVMPSSVVRPTNSTASMTVGTPSGAMVSISVRVVSVPLWQVLLVLFIVGGGSWRLSRRVFPAGHCSQCGYDLQGLESGKCPECGGGFVARAMAAARRAINSRRSTCMVRV